MPRTSMRQLSDREAVCRDAADEFVRCVAAAVATRGRFSVALSGGSTPKRLYELLAERPFRDDIDWTRLEIFWGDERAVPPDHADSNYGMTRRALLSRVPLPEGRVHRLRGEAPDLDAAAHEYEAEIARVLDASPGGEPPRLDLVLLGLGSDAHTASLFPNTAALRESLRWVVANDVEKLDTRRLTMTSLLLNRARRVLFLVAGRDKREALTTVLEGEFDPERRPAQLIRPEAGELLWLADEAALAGLGNGKPT